MSIFTAPELVVFVFYETIISSLSSAMIMAASISAGGTAGSTAIYFGARLVGRKRCLDLLKRHGKKVLLKPEDMESIDYCYERWGGRIIFFGRWLPAFRSLVSIPAGLSSMPPWRFVALTFSGTMVWNMILCSLLFGFGAYLDYLAVGLEGYTWLASIALVLLGAWFILKRISEKIMAGNNSGDD